MLVTSPSTSSPRISSKEEGDYHSGLGSSDMTTSQHQLSSVGGSQDRLLCVPMVGSNSSSTATTPVGGAAAGGAPPTTPVVNNPPAVSPTDPAVRRRRLSNLYKVISWIPSFFCCLFLIYDRYIFPCHTTSSVFFFYFLWESRLRVRNTLASASIALRIPDKKNLWQLQKEPA